MHFDCPYFYDQNRKCPERRDNASDLRQHARVVHRLDVYADELWWPEFEGDTKMFRRLTMWRKAMDNSWAFAHEEAV